MLGVDHVGLGSDFDGFFDSVKVQDFEEVTNCIFHDAVESVARLWLKAWERFTGRSHSNMNTS